MCEEAPAVIYCVGYILPIGCCLAGACMSCYGCYRYYYATRMRRMQAGLNGSRQIVLEQPKLKRDTLKSRITERFLSLIGSKENATLEIELKDISLKDLKESCPICLMDYEKDTSQVFIGLIKGCGHYFHFECIWEWLEHKQTCPICREACELAETDIRGLSLKQVLDFLRVEGQVQGLGLPMDKEKKAGAEFVNKTDQNCSGINVAHIHLEQSTTSSGGDGETASSRSRDYVVLNRHPHKKSPLNQRSPKGEHFLGRQNPAFQNEAIEESGQVSSHDKDEMDVTSPEITRI